jgi:Na+/H+ antiporter NhaA
MKIETKKMSQLNIGIFVGFLLGISIGIFLMTLLITNK